MSNAILFISYKLVEGASVPDFQCALQDCLDEVVSKKKGFVCSKLLASGDTWVDLVTWETMDDAANALKDDGVHHPAADKFFSFIDFNSLTSQIYSVEKSYQ